MPTTGHSSKRQAGLQQVYLTNPEMTIAGGTVTIAPGTLVRVGREATAANSWSVQHIPAANTQATITKAAAGADVRNVCTALTVALATVGVITPPTDLKVRLIDGASGGSTYLWGIPLTVPNVLGQCVTVGLTGLWLVGSQNTALTLEFSAAGGLNTLEAVCMSGIILTE